MKMFTNSIWLIVNNKKLINLITKVKIFKKKQLLGIIDKSWLNYRKVITNYQEKIIKRVSLSKK